MVRAARLASRSAATALIAFAAPAVGETAARASTGSATRSTASSGGAAIAGLPPSTRGTENAPPPPSTHDHGSWMPSVTITEYWPAPERWFVGELVRTSGLPSRHRIDWLYSALGVSMEGQGLGLDGRMYHLDAPGSGGWVTVRGVGASPSSGWAA